MMFLPHNAVISLLGISSTEKLAQVQKKLYVYVYGPSCTLHHHLLY